MASLDKSLDDIISSTKRGKKFIPKKGKALVKRPGKLVKPAIKAKTLVKLNNSRVNNNKPNLLDGSYATKVVVYGLPKDIKQDAIKDFFQSQVGGVSNIACSYNERGQFKGIATIIFNSSKAAGRAVEKYNGAPIDNGSNKLKLELIIDPTKKPLSSRIAANSGAGAKSLKSLNQRIKSVGGKPNAGPKAGAKAGPKSGPKPGKKPVKKAPRKEKKTIEQLDQEMADYFEN